MFIEPNLKGEKRGWIEVICGSMFSGKTEELIRRLKRVSIANLKAEIFKPAVDNRYDMNKIVSHDTNTIPSTPVEHSSAILWISRIPFRNSFETEIRSG
jgi:thymidine kinase